MSNVGNVTLMSPPTSTSSTQNPNSTLTQQDFLQLMVAQFTQQDPLADGGDGSGDSGSQASDYVNQLMSMTNLTTMQTMSAQQGVQLAQSLPGATATITNSDNSTVTGVVTGTTITSSGVDVTINGSSYAASSITALTPTPAATNTGTTSN